MNQRLIGIFLGLCIPRALIKARIYTRTLAVCRDIARAEGFRQMVGSSDSDACAQAGACGVLRFALLVKTTMAVATANPLAAPGPLQDVVKPHFHQVLLPAESFIKNDLGLKLDKGTFLLAFLRPTPQLTIA
jgi:hypothetical protein